MKETLAYIHKHVFAGIDGTTPAAEKRGHDYSDEYAAFMDEFDRMTLNDSDDDLEGPDDNDNNPDDDNDVPEHPPPSSPTALHHDWHPQLNATEAGPPAMHANIPRNQNATAGPSKQRAKKKQPPVIGASTLADGSHGVAEPRVVRQTRGQKDKGKGKGKAKAS